MTPDGTGGAFAVWLNLSSQLDVRVLRIDALGVDPTWPSEGLVASAGHVDVDPSGIAPDATGGVLVSYATQGFGLNDGWLTRVSSSGEIVEGWSPSRSVCAFCGPRPVADGSGGAYAVWQRNNAYETVHPISVARWTSSGVPVWGVELDQQPWGTFPAAVPDAAGGVIVSWPATAVSVDSTGKSPWGVNLCQCGSEGVESATDDAGGAIVAWHQGATVFAQRVGGAGAIAPGWNANGMVAGTASANIASLKIVPDSEGGALIAWYDVLGRAYLTRLTASGAVAPGWPAGAMQISASVRVVLGATPTELALARDTHGGAYVVWTDVRSGSSGADIFAQHVMASGSVAAGWHADGSPICTALGNQQGPGAASDGAGGLIVGWLDSRDHFPLTAIYAQHVLDNETIPLAVTGASLSRELRFIGLTPNPAVGSCLVEFESADAKPVWIEVLDIAGRQLERRHLSTISIGRNVVRVGDDTRMAPGIYVVRISQGPRVRFAKLAIVR